MKNLISKIRLCAGAALVCALLLASCSIDDGVLPTLSTNAPAEIAFKADGTGGMPFIEITTNQLSWDYAVTPADGAGWLTVTKVGYLLVLEAAPNIANVTRDAVNIIITAGDAAPVTVTLRQGVRAELNITGIAGDFVVSYTNGDKADMTVSGGKGMVDILNTSSPRTIYSITSDATGEVFVGRKEDESINLKFASNAVVFRDAIDSKIPVGTYAELALINEGDIDGDYIQDADIDLLGNVAAGVTRKNWQPLFWVAVGPTADGYFEGTYDGNGFVIENIYIYRTDIDNIALFSTLSSDGVLKNIAIASGEVTGYKFTAAIAGLSYGLIDNCSNNATVSGSFVAGGVCAYSEGAMEKCYNTGTVYGIAPIAGDVEVRCIGGVCGNSEEGATMYYCYNEGVVSGVTGTVMSMSVGGVCGESYGDMDFCYNEGTVSGHKEVGGVCGLNGWSTINACSNTDATVSGVEDIGGITGYNSGIVSGCYTEGGTVNGTEYVGGVVGWNDEEMYECYNENTVVTGTEAIGGVCGFSYNLTYECYNMGKVTGQFFTGGVVGWNYGELYACDNSGEVTGTSGSKYIGGVCGANENQTIWACYNTADVSGSQYVGGVVGYNTTESTLLSSYNTGNVSGTANYVGGVCGANDYTATTRACYNTGEVSGPSNSTGGAIGVNGYPDEDGEGYVYDCYWLNHGASSAVNGIGYSLDVDGATDDNAAAFAADSWPSTALNGWGTGTGNGANKYWKPLIPDALGGWVSGGSPEGTNSTFPKLYFEQ